MKAINKNKNTLIKIKKNYVSVMAWKKKIKNIYYIFIFLLILINSKLLVSI